MNTTTRTIIETQISNLRNAATKLEHDEKVDDARDQMRKSAGWLEAVLEELGRTEPEPAEPPAPLTREQLPATVRDMLNAAVRMHLIDPVGLALLVHQHGADCEALLGALDGAGADFTADTSSADAWARLRGAVMWLTDHDKPATESAERFGFRDVTRAKMLAVVERWAVRV